MKSPFTQSKKKMTYDEINDILYITFTNDRGNSYAEEEERGIEVMYDSITDDVTGVMVFSPKTRREDRQSKLDKLGFCIDLSSVCV